MLKALPQPWIAWAFALVAATCLVASAQPPLGNTGVFPLHRADMPPGAVGQGQLLRGGPLAGYFQPVAFHVADDARVAIWNGETFQPLTGSSPLVGLLAGQVYRLKITNIKGRPGAEVYPTVELVSRLFPPRGLELKHPVPIEFAAEEVTAALRGLFVTRVVYLENPDQALPVRDAPHSQRVFEVGVSDDPLQAADRLGRPMAIVRIGSRVPNANELATFGYGAPPFRVFPQPARSSASATSRGNDRSSIEQAVERSARIPRLPTGNAQQR